MTPFNIPSEIMFPIVGTGVLLIVIGSIFCCQLKSMRTKFNNTIQTLNKQINELRDDHNDLSNDHTELDKEYGLLEEQQNELSTCLTNLENEIYNNEDTEAETETETDETDATEETQETDQSSENQESTVAPSCT
jgi:peptidoglycan hydrolase CwlO-like protein